ncbi:hypothetical protein CON03_20375 [Bacillus cereus]|nr:hypothetical protein CON03_20375 [Bacillus cereus]
MSNRFTDILTKKFKGKIWSEKVINFLITHTFTYILNIIIGLLGIGHLLYSFGYVFLYGFYFGESNPSLIGIVNQYVPFTVIECIMVGVFNLAIIAFFTMLAYLSFKKKISPITSLLCFIAFFLILNITIIFVGFSTNFSAIGYFLTTYWTEVVKIMLYILFAVVLFILAKLFIDVIIKDANNAEYSLFSFLGFTLIIFGITVACIVPLTSTTVLKVGTSLGNVLVAKGYTQNKYIFIGECNKPYIGQVVAKDSDYLYLTTVNRELLIVQKSGKKHQESIYHTENITKENDECKH